MPNIDAEVLKAVGSAYYVNNYTKDAIDYYEKSLNYEEEVDTHLYVGIAYYKAGRESNSVDYFKEAVEHLKKAVEKYPGKANYYLALCYTKLGNATSAITAFEKFSKSTYMEEANILITSIESFIARKAKRMEDIKEAFESFSDPILADVFQFLHKYLEGSDIEERLAKKYDASPEQGLAYEIEHYYKKVFGEEKGESPLIKHVKVILYILKGEEAEKEFPRLGKYGLTKRFISTLPVLTRAIVSEFVKEFGGSEAVKDLPYLIIRLFQPIKELSKAYKAVLKGKRISRAKLVSRLKDLSRKLRDKELTKRIKYIESGKGYRTYILQTIVLAIQRGLGALQRRAEMFFDERELRNVMKLLISDLKLSQQEKTELLLGLE